MSDRESGRHDPVQHDPGRQNPVHDDPVHDDPVHDHPVQHDPGQDDPGQDEPVHEVTALLVNWSNGDRDALDELMPLVYGELRRLAGAHLRRERSGHTLQCTALVHEAFLRLVDQREVHWRSRAHFFGIAARMIRRILVDHARSQHAGKRGAGAIKLELGEAMAVSHETQVDLVGLDEALERLAAMDQRQGRIVELRFFAGLSVEETAEVMHLSQATVKREWSSARAWLYREILKV